MVNLPERGEFSGIKGCCLLYVTYKRACEVVWNGVLCEHDADRKFGSGRKGPSCGGRISMITSEKYRK